MRVIQPSDFKAIPTDDRRQLAKFTPTFDSAKQCLEGDEILVAQYSALSGGSKVYATIESEKDFEFVMGKVPILFAVRTAVLKTP
jgi:hypothetical protein